VFEIGNSLREARLRQGLELPRIETETKIRGKYLRALEEEQFEILPGETYVKGFLRTYAEYLGLDGQLYVDEYNSRFTTAEEPVATPSSPSRRPPRPRLESNFVIVTLAGIVAVTILAVVVLTGLGGGDDPATDPLLDTPSETTTPTTTGTGAVVPAPQPARRARLVLTAARGDCWMSVRANSASGPLLYQGSLEQGQTQRFVKWRRVWIELGAPANLRVRLNGKAVRFPRRQAVVLVTAKGVRTLATA
jgi:cytoskeleton protein RodZ